MRKRRALTVISTMLAGACVVSCAAVLGFERLSEEGGIVFDGGTDAGSDGSPVLPTDSGAEASACSELGVPARPVDAGAAGGPAVLVAVNLLDFGVDQDGGADNVPGFNLDLKCSTDVASVTCKSSVAPSGFDKHVKDKSAAGLDNAGFSLIKYINGLSEILTASTINQGIADGKYGAVIRITNWSGAADDDDLQVEVFPAIGMLPRQNPDAGFGAGDQWVLDKRFQVAGGVEASNVKSDVAWVSGNQLVARFSEVYFPILIDRDPKPFDIRMTDVIFTGTLTSTNGVTSLTRGTVAGRWKTADFLGQVRTIYVDAEVLEDAVLCEPKQAAQILYGAVKSEVCNARDLRSDNSDTGNLGCDAVSAAMRIEAYPVTNLGVFDAGPNVPPRCQMDGAVPAGDDCAPN